MTKELITKIDIQKAASFKNYTHNSDLLFERNNVFFGYNGCGKTTLSRIFCCLEKAEVIDELTVEDIEIPSFSITTNNNIYNEQKLDSSLKIKVFNEDYVSKNINYDSLTGVLIAGEESREKQNKIEELKKKSANLGSQLDVQIKKREQIKTEIRELTLKIEKERSFVAKFIKDQLSGYDNAFDRKKLDKFKSKPEFKKYKSQMIDLDSEIKNYNGRNKLSIKRYTSLAKVSEHDIENINALLASSVLDSVKIAEITAEFERWASDGLELHKDKDQCTLCGSSFTYKRKKELNSHFSDEYKILILNISTQIDKLKNLKLTNIEHYYDWYDELREEGERCKLVTNIKINAYNEYLSKIIETLKSKKINAFNTELEVMYRDFDLDTDALNIVIEKHNERCDNFELSKIESAKKVICYKILDMEKSADFQDKKNKIDSYNTQLLDTKTAIDYINEQKKNTDTEISVLSKEVHELKIGAEMFNQYLEELLPSLNLKVETLEDNFTLKRNGYSVRYLSEGERNVLSFVYFVLSFSHGRVKKEELKKCLDDWIVFIDDPISSLDDTNLHLIAGFIKNHFKNTKQLFITTHNFSFWRCFRNTKHDKGYSHFLIEKQKGSSTVLPLNKDHVLVKHQYDYTFIYSKLRAYIAQPVVEENINVLNHLRKFLEYFSSFMYPNSAGVDKILETLLNNQYKLSNDIESYILYRLSNEGSHMQTRTHFISKDPNSISENIEKVMKAMEIAYPDHIKSLNNHSKERTKS